MKKRAARPKSFHFPLPAQLGMRLVEALGRRSSRRSGLTLLASWGREDGNGVAMLVPSACRSPLLPVRTRPMRKGAWAGAWTRCNLKRVSG